MISINDPLGYNPGIGPSEICFEVGYVSIWKILKGIPKIKFLRKMKNSPEKICESLVFEEDRIFQQAHKK
jgi:hypothetical protein